MNDPENALDRAPAAAQIAAAGAAGSKDRTSPGQHPVAGGQAGQPASATQAAAGNDPA